jgi:hypothetical protein
VFVPLVVGWKSGRRGAVWPRVRCGNARVGIHQPLRHQVESKMVGDERGQHVLVALLLVALAETLL